MFREDKKRITGNMKKIDKKRVRVLTKQGLSQQKIAKLLGVRKSRIGVVQASQGAVRPQVKGAYLFMEDVKTVQRMEHVTWKKAIRLTKDKPFWYKKRAKGLTKSFESLEARFQAGEKLTKKENKRRRWLKGKIQSEKLKKWWSDNERKPDPEEMADEMGMDEDDIAEYELWEA